MAQPRYCFVAEVCRELGISRRTMMRMRAANKLPVTELPRLGRKLRFSRESVETLLQSRWASNRRIA